MDSYERLTRWMLGHAQPTPYCLDLDHPAQDDLAWAADRIRRLENAMHHILNNDLCENQIRHVAIEALREKN